MTTVEGKLAVMGGAAKINGMMGFSGILGPLQNSKSFLEFWVFFGILGTFQNSLFFLELNLSPLF